MYHINHKTSAVLKPFTSTLDIPRSSLIHLPALELLPLDWTHLLDLYIDLSYTG